MDLDLRLGDARRRYVETHPVSRDWWDRARVVMPGGNTRSVLHYDPFPIRVTQAEGRFLHDAEGHTYVDLLGNYTAGLFGHSPLGILSAVHKAIDDGVALGGVAGDEVRLAEALVARFDSIDLIRFTNSGTEANLMAISAALHHTGRAGVVVFDGAYHGGVLYFGDHGREVNVPHRWLHARYNDLESVRSHFESDPDGIGCILVEPMQGSAGCIPAEPEFLSGLRTLADRYDALLVFDEVMTSRLSFGGAQHLYGVASDLTTLGKYLGGGLGFGAFGGRRTVMKAFDPAAGGGLSHAGTFNNDVVSMAAGVAAAEHLTPQLLDDLNRRGDRLREALGSVLARVGMSVSGVGSLMNVHAVPGPVRSVDDLTAADDRLLELWFFESLAAGFYPARRGFIALSLEVTDGDVDRYVDAVEAALSGL
ncbi:MAG: aminotransferase class III-fold pyridoxal phosphate-dependent enzyme [Acidimicrobiia bacterium]|nr:aminotransferase class III-fold pyridoxal phosphate-dependent enzyme [Acidimicrobiia bacterium]